MKDRIKKLMDKDGYNPNTFADYLGINRQTMNATLGRNKVASVHVIMAILEKYEDLNAEWLLLGKGPMYKGEKAFLQPSLFEESEIKPYKEPEISEYRKEMIVEQPEIIQEPINKQEVMSKISASKKIDKIMIFYNDNTFTCFSPGE